MNRLFFCCLLLSLFSSLHGQESTAPIDIKNKLSSYVGRVEALETIQQIAPFTGRTIKQLVSPGEFVKKGQPIMIIAQRTLGETYANYTTTANISGILNEFHVSPGYEFTTAAPLFTLLDTSKHRIKLAVSNKDHSLIKTNSTVFIHPENEEQAIQGSVYRKSLTPITNSGLFVVEINIPNSVPIGTFCEVSFASENDLDKESPKKSKKGRRKKATSPQEVDQ